MEEAFVAEAIKLAKKAGSLGEVPVGALVVSGEGRILGRGRNRAYATKSSVQHAEIVAIQKAQRALGDWRLEGCCLYVTLEPCLMCLGAVGNARISKVCYLLADPLFGSVESKIGSEQTKALYPNLEVVKLPGGEQVRELMHNFFVGLREKTKQDRMGSNS